MPMRTIQTVCVAGILSFVVASGLGSVRSMASEPQPSETKPDVAPGSGSKDAEGKIKEPDTKPKEPESKPKEPEAKPTDQKSKDSDTKAKEPEPKAKDGEAKPKGQEPKAKESTTKPKESEHKAKEGESKSSKEPDQKSKEPEAKPKDAEIAAEHPCPSVPQAADAKPQVEAPVPSGDSGTGERQKSEPEPKKPVRSSMVTAKLALMADPHLFPYDIEVDAKDKDLVLLGKVGQESDKRVATDIIRCLEGVHAVENRLKVEADAAHGLFAERDKIITQLVKERFEKSKTLQSVKFDVKTEDGVVTLNGATRFQIIVLEAAQAARQVPGVRAVNTDAVRLVAGE
ncbi:MAG: BON domain-containing protein [Nitrospira sp.]|nr:BON domain-containing protein [Nitrospira sp.]MBX7038979.1 BON domain-containing protein [Nitrospira sp.]HMU29479.1 BON domain-containing protein [Nitrospira sp.]HMV57636.1 BON domain-containing protein [Nitrospira sp.]HMW85544.1 BON domain-containing protein [Nitrospira sp.]